MADDIFGDPEEEFAIIDRLLQAKGILRYEIINSVHEGKDLPASNGRPVESRSGTVITAHDVYGFWLDWANEDYTLGDEKRRWLKIERQEWAGDEEVIAVQERIQQRMRSEDR